MGTSKRLIRGILLLLIFLFPAPLAAELESFNFKVIRIAFMNGYVRALTSDLEKIKNLKENKKQMREFLDIEVSKYMKEVSDLNDRMPHTAIAKRSIKGVVK